MTTSSLPAIRSVSSLKKVFHFKTPSSSPPPPPLSLSLPRFILSHMFQISKFNIIPRCIRRHRHPHKTQSPSNQQNRPLPPRPLTPIRLPALSIQRTQSLGHSAQSRLPRPQMSTKHDNLQTARNRRCSTTASRLYIFVYGSA
jgi:hypothetical protein